MTLRTELIAALEAAIEAGRVPQATYRVTDGELYRLAPFARWIDGHWYVDSVWTKVNPIGLTFGAYTAREP
jgi:hypothetical protein